MTDRKKFFEGTPQNQVVETKKKEEVNKRPAPVRKIIGWSLGMLFVVILLCIVAFQVITLYIQISQSWDEIIFAYQKPEIVKAVRLDYVSQQQALENSFVTRQKQALQAK